MTDLENYVQQCQHQGQSDEAISQSLLSAGWTPDQFKYLLKQAPVADTTDYLEKKSRRLPFLMFVVIAAIVMVAAGIYLFLRQSSWSQTPKSAAKTPTAPPALVVYIRSRGTGPDGQVEMYDLSNSSRLTPLPAEQSQNIGPWSANGQYLLLQSIPQTIQQGSAVYLFDSTSLKAKKIVSFEAGNVLSYFFNEAYWTANDKFAIDRPYTPTNDKTTINSYDLAGGEKISTGPAKITNEDFFKVGDWEFQEEFPVSTASGMIKSIKSASYRGKIIENIKGFPVGSVKNYLVTVENPPIRDLLWVMSDPSLAKQLVDIKDPKQREIKLKELILPSHDWTFHFYTITSEVKIQSVKVTEPKGILTFPQIRPGGQTIIFTVEDDVLQPKTRQFFELSPGETAPRFLFEAGASVNSLGLQPFTTADGNWVVYSEPGKDKMGTLNSITARNLNTLKTQAICQDACTRLSVYSPASSSKELR